MLKDLGAAEVRLSGIHTMAQSVSGWRLPPGFEIAAGALELRFSHSPTLLSPGSWFDVMIDGMRDARQIFTPEQIAEFPPLLRASFDINRLKTTRPTAGFDPNY